MAKGRRWWERLPAAWRTLAGKRGGYAAGEFNRLLADWLATGASPDELLRWSNGRIRMRARDLERNNPIVRQYLRLLGSNVVGPDGIKLQAQVRNNSGDLYRQLNDRIEAGWADWATNVTADGRMGLVQLQVLALCSVARDGEAFVRLWRGYRDNPYGLALELVDPELVDEQYNVPAGEGTNEVRLGVEVNSYGRPVAYHVFDRPELQQTAPRRRLRIPADELLHLYLPERANQTRGVSWLASIIPAVWTLERYAESELVAARISAAKMGFFQRKDGAVGPSALGPDETGAGQGLMMEASPGSFGVLPDGYELATFAPDHPSTAYGAFTKDVMRRIAVGLGVSYNALASDLENVNYSSMRSGLLVERDTWRTVQAWWASAFLSPVYAQWLNMALANGKVTLDSRDFRRFLAVRWCPRGWPWVDPAKDTAAGVQAISAGLTSRTQLLAEQGQDVETVLEELAEEQRLAEEYGVTLAGGGAAAPAAAPEAEPEEEPEEEPAEEDAGEPAGNGNGRGTAAARRF